jgi:hypothetical protein
MREGTNDALQSSLGGQISWERRDLRDHDDDLRTRTEQNEIETDRSQLKALDWKRKIGSEDQRTLNFWPALAALRTRLTIAAPTVLMTGPFASTVLARGRRRDQVS